jgi:hypothetical protein
LDGIPDIANVAWTWTEDELDIIWNTKPLVPNHQISSMVGGKLESHHKARKYTNTRPLHHDISNGFRVSPEVGRSLHVSKRKLFGADNYASGPASLLAINHSQHDEAKISIDDDYYEKDDESDFDGHNSDDYVDVDEFLCAQKKTNHRSEIVLKDEKFKQYYHKILTLHCTQACQLGRRCMDFVRSNLALAMNMRDQHWGKLNAKPRPTSFRRNEVKKILLIAHVGSNR